MIQVLITLLSVIVCQITNNPLVQYFQPDAYLDCPVLDLRNICVERCEDALLECILDCNNDSACLSECIRIETDCIGHCPCEVFCLEGCNECENPVCQCEAKEINEDWNKCIDENSSILGGCIYACNGDRNCDADCSDQFRERQLECPCEENCIGGCPCPNYSCTETTASPDVTTTSQPDTTTAPTANAVLILNNHSSSNMPIVVDFDGNINENLAFEYGSGARANSGCGVTMNGEFWYFGFGKRVSKVIGCQLVRQADMAFDLDHPACNTFLEPAPAVLLCFSAASNNECHLFDGEVFRTIEIAKYSHQYTEGLGNYKGRALTTGCMSGNSDCSIKTEVLDLNTLKWSDGPDYPFTSFEISSYSTAQSAHAAYIIGGSYTKNIVAEFKNDQWNRLDDLKKGRNYHGSITIGTQTMIVGGIGADVQTEVWELENGNNKVITPILSNYYFGIGLYAVDFNFCST